MKLKTRLMVAFCIIIILPIALRRSGNSRIIPDTDKGNTEKLWSGGIGYPGGIVEFPAADEPLYENGI